MKNNETTYTNPCQRIFFVWMLKKQKTEKIPKQKKQFPFLTWLRQQTYKNADLFFTWCVYSYIETTRADCFCDSWRTIAT